MRYLAIGAALLLLAGCTQAEPSARDQSQPSVESSATSTESAQQAGSAAEPEQVEEVQAETEESTSEVSSDSAIKEDSEVPDYEGQQSDSSSGVEATATATPTEASEEPVPAPTIVGYTMEEVAENSAIDSCWVAIDGGVYDLTMWIKSHPGGEAAILQLCGADGTQMFLGQHGGQARPSSTLDDYYIGPLR